MAKAYKLTWDKRSKRWKKKHQGKQYYFPFGESKTDDVGYKLALEAWQHIKSKIDGTLEDDTTKATAIREQILQWSYNRPPDDMRESPKKHIVEIAHFIESIEDDIAEMEANIIRTNPLTLDQLGIEIDPLFGRSAEFKLYWQECIPNLGRQNEPPKRQEYSTIAKHIQSYLGKYLRRAKIGQISSAHYENTKTRLTPLIKFWGSDMPTKNITGNTLTEYHDYLLSEIEHGRLNALHSSQAMAECRKFVRWLYTEEIIDKLPRTLMAGSRSLSIKVTPKPVEIFTIDEIQTLLEHAPERTQLYILLCLNCGMYQSDISDLSPKEVNWKQGRITRKRSKTKGEKNVPTVTYKLWQPTLELLKKHRTADKNRVLLNANGNPLRIRELLPDGRVSNFDSVGKAWQRLNAKLKNNGVKNKKQLKALRKTSASILESHEVYGRYAGHFLGHAPQTIADKHYVKPSDELFDKAIEWLGHELRITKSA